jgi:1-aminocyclopropane-1-carboxylate deaminase/D-cysteine desulfhydrase-like pyridoxal-dependent ACC family enzyme
MFNSQSSDLISTLTPVMLEEGLHVKRDDLFALEPKAAIRGGKLRQCMAILGDAEPTRLITAGSIHSPQIPIVAYVAHHIKIPCTVLVGGKRNTQSLILARRFGAEILRCRTGRHTVLFNTARTLQAPSDFVVPFGMRPREPCRRFYDACAAQVRNIPANIKTTVIASGSGVTASIVAYGLWLSHRWDHEIALVNLGPDRREQILRTLYALDPNSSKWVEKAHVLRVFPLSRQSNFRYEAPIPFQIGRIELNPLYEGKAFKWFMDNVDFDWKRTLFWVTGPPVELSA